MNNGKAFPQSNGFNVTSYSVAEMAVTDTSFIKAPLGIDGGWRSNRDSMRTRVNISADILYSFPQQEL